MKTFPSDIERKIDFAHIREWLIANCQHNGGKQLAVKMSVSSSLPQIELWLDQVSEYRNILQSGKSLPISNIEITSALEQLKVDNQILEDEDFLNVRLVCKDSQDLLEFFLKSPEYPNLFKVAEKIDVPSEIVVKIDQVFDEQGRWKRNASVKLQEILGESDQLERRAFTRLTKLYEQGQANNWTADTGITVKEGRMVIPILAEHKKKIQGIVHDESGGGKILYIEPLEVLEFTNRMKELEMERDREMRRIRSKLSSLIYPYVSDLLWADKVMAILDFIRSKGRLASDLEAVKPKIFKEKKISFSNLYHPQLLMINRPKGKPVIPMTLELDPDQRIMIVSGPNAGGKSVAIKTLMLNQYMLQCGILIPCAPDSSTTVFRNFMVDIGDSQSIENDLSSYSGHLTAMKYFLENADSSSLIIIDEIGSGTDPNFGGAMAESILLELNRKRVMGMVTTHFGNIKTIANKTPGLINGSMAFDMDHLKPLYRLKSGIPGSSFALEVATNIGLDPTLIKTAKQRSNTVEQKTDELLARLETEREKVQFLNQNLENERKHLESIRSAYEQLKSDLAKARKDIVDEARKKAMEIVKDSNSLVEKSIREIRESQADRRVIGKIRKERERFVSEQKKDLGISDVPEKKKEKLPPKVIDLEIGTIVKIPNSDASGEIVEIRKDKAVVVAGIMKSTFPLTELKGIKEPVSKKRVRINYDLIKAKSEFVMEKDVRGMRGEEALREIDKWMDQAIVAGAPQIRLIHGKGDGILKRLIHDYYHKNPYVKHIKTESIEAGGEGVSIIELR
ncbi:MAG: hypothetical protein GC181_03760 [Bacteroidetes bacterium]|nr:hypothetical protein [Bacteroidota bacterium]